MELIRIQHDKDIKTELDLSQGLRALTVPEEQAEALAVLNGCKTMTQRRLVLRYHKGSEKMGKAYNIDCRLWDVLSPKLKGYMYNSESHIPTLSIEGLKEKGLLK